MNTVGKDTRAAEKLFTEVWGDKLLNRVYLLSEGKSVSDLQNEGDRLLEMAGKDEAKRVSLRCFCPFPDFSRKGKETKQSECLEEFLEQAKNSRRYRGTAESGK